MLEFIAKYWIEVVFGFIISGVTIFFKHHMKLQKEHNDVEQEKLKKELRESSLKDHEDAMERIDQLELELKHLRKGLLSIQGKLFREFCEELLTEYEEIPVDLYEQMEDDYAAYKGLGGNHRGDSLHTAVVEKFKS